jgi:hypothetical protein
METPGITNPELSDITPTTEPASNCAQAAVHTNRVKNIRTIRLIIDDAPGCSGVSLLSKAVCRSFDLGFRFATSSTRFTIVIL